VQEIGTEICNCAANSYEFTLDFALTCPPVNITLGDAVAATTCMVSPFGTPEVSDLVPVSVTSIDILELNQNLQVMVQENIAPVDPFKDGDTFSYVSYAAIPGEIVNPEDLPRAIQLNIVGINANGEEIINVYLITFTNSCGAYPVLQEGQWAGWTRFSDLGLPNPDLCPIARPPSPPPTPSPTLFPTLGMSMSMSMKMDLGFEGFSIEDLLDGQINYKASKSKGGAKGGKQDKSKSGGKAGKGEYEKLGKPNSKDGKAKDGKAKDGKSKDGKAKDGKAKDGKAKDGKSKDGKAKGGTKAGKSEKAKDGAFMGGIKDGKPWTNSKDGKAKDGKSKDGKVKDGKSKDGKAKDGSKSGKAKDGAKDGKSAKHVNPKETNKLAKPGDKVGKPYSKDGKAKAGKSEKAKDGAFKGGIKDGKPWTNSKDGKAKDGAKDGKSGKAKDGAKAGKSGKYEENERKENVETPKEANKLAKSDKSKEGKGVRKRIRI